ncbi:MAG TPA: energy transducer TonB [Flavobacterium sp.]|nr:energy transducer TonB [Flavobacterium sp.]
MKWIAVIVLAFLPMVSFAQIGGEDEVYLNGDRIEAKFKGGGIDKFSEFVHSEFDYSKVSKPGKMLAAFTIDEEGNLKNIKLLEYIDTESAGEMIRVLNKCPKWEPAKRNGKPISIEIKYPMVFKAKKK